MFKYLVGTVAAQQFTKQVIDDMADHFGDESPYLPEFWDEVVDCMGKFDDAGLVTAVDDTWKGMVDYYQHPRSSDPWVDCVDHPTETRCIEPLW